MKKLNLGCGTDIREGWVNLDISEIEGIDVVWDIENLPLPFDEGEIDYVLCQDLLEHVEYIAILKDIHRILKPGGVVEIRVPHFTSRNNFVDPTHKKQFSIRTFNFFVKESFHGRSYYFDFAFSRIDASRITFQKGMHLHNYFIELFLNLFDKPKDTYENTFLSRLFPALNVEVKLVK